MGIISHGVCNPGDSCLVTEERAGNWASRLRGVIDGDQEDVQVFAVCSCDGLASMAIMEGKEKQSAIESDELLLQPTGGPPHQQNTPTAKHMQTGSPCD